MNESLVTFSKKWDMDYREASRSFSSKRLLISLGSLVLMLGACGIIKSRSSRGSRSQSALSASEPGTAQVRRLSKLELDNTIQRLTGDQRGLALQLPPDEEALGYTNGYNLSVSQLFLDQWQIMAGQIAAQVVAVGSKQQKQSASCRSGKNPETCAESFVLAFGKAALRRPLLDTEKTELLGLFAVGQKLGSFEQGMQLVVEALLLSPSFLYRTEIGAEGLGAGANYELTAFELAQNLAYTLTAFPPDETLMAAAENGALEGHDEFVAQARRLMASEEGQKFWHHFIFDWLKIAGVGSIQRSHPQWSDALPLAFRSETERFIDHIMQEEQGSLTKLLDADYSFVDSSLAKLYGIAEPSAGAPGLASLEGTGRRGILSQGAFLSVHAQIGGSSPVRRGVVILERLFCRTLPPPPPGVAMVPAEIPNGTTRDRFAAHSNNPSCQGCHSLIDPLGFAFENFDGLGVFRSQENGKNVDASGELLGRGDISGAFENSAELIAKLAVSEDIRSCVSKQLFRYALGRSETNADAATLDSSLQNAEAQGMDLREILFSLVNSDQFKQRTKTGP